MRALFRLVEIHETYPKQINESYKMVIEDKKDRGYKRQTETQEPQKVSNIRQVVTVVNISKKT